MRPSALRNELAFVLVRGYMVGGGRSWYVSQRSGRSLALSEWMLRRNQLLKRATLFLSG